jgi:hypothetical protein
MNTQISESSRQPVEDWEKMYLSGKGYRKTVKNAQNRKDVFTPSIIRNICALGIESYFMAVFMHRGILPHNHTMQDLLDDAEKLFPVDPALKKTMLKIDDQMQLCSLDNFKLTDASADDVAAFIKALDDADLLAGGELGIDGKSAHT